jgi:hypothetical protein
VFDQLQAAGIQDRVSDAIYKWRGIATWPEAEASVTSCSYAYDNETPGNGTYTVAFVYQSVNGFEAGQLLVWGREEHSPYFKGDTFTLRYNPKHPNRFYYAGERSPLGTLLLLIFFVVLGASGALIAISLSSR